MVRKKINKIIMLISIVSAVLLLTTSLGAAFDPGLSDDRNPEDDGRIGFDDEAKDQEPDPRDITAETGFEDDVTSQDTITDGVIIIGEDEETSTLNNLLRLVVESDTLPDGSEGGEIPSEPSIEVDEVFVASNGIVDKELAIGTSIPLNIIGYARINVSSGQSNIEGVPYFDGYDVLDNAAFAITSSSAFIVLGVAKLIYNIKPQWAEYAIDFGFYVADVVLNAILDFIETGIFSISITFEFGPIQFTLDLKGKIVEAIMSLAQSILDLVDGILDGSILSGIIEDIQTALDQSELEYTFKKFITNEIPLWAGVGAMIKRVRGKAYNPDIYNWLRYDCNLGHFKAQNVISFLQSSDEVFEDIRVKTIGQIDVFLTKGRIEENNQYIQLRNLRIDFNNGVQNGYAAIINIDIFSAGNIVNTTKVGIICDDIGEELVGMETAPLNSEPVVEGSSTTETETMEEGSSSTEMTGTTGSTSL
jgi:hypothetical protein